MSFTLPDDFTTPPDDPNADPNDFSPTPDGGLYHGEPYQTDSSGRPDAFVGGQGVDWTNGDPGARGPNGYVAGSESDLQGNGGPGGSMSGRHTPGSPTAGIYNDIVAAQGGVPPSGPNGTVSPTDSIYNDIVNAQGGQFPQGPNGPGAPPAAVAGDLPGAAARYTPPAASDPNAHFITRLGVDSTPTAAGAGGVNLPGSGAPGSFQQEFQKQFGFYNPEFNSQANMEHNLLMGDSVIRPQAEYMAQFDPNLKAELATINGLPDFYNSENAAKWDAAHNNQLTGRVAAGDLSLAAAKGQGVNVPGHPVDNAHALATQGMQDSLVQTLAQMGVDPNSFHQSFDPYGNATLNFTSASGKPQTVQATLVGYANAIEQLKQNVAATAQPPAGGGLPQRPAPSRPAPPRGGGGFAPPQAPQPPSDTSGYTPPPAGAGAFAYGSSGGFPAIAAPGTFNNHGQQQNPLLLGPNIPNGQPY